MVTVVSPHLLAVGAAWDDGPDAGAWIADRLGPFGPSVGHAVPLGYEAYAVVPVPAPHFDCERYPSVQVDAIERDSLPVIEGVLEVLGSLTSQQPVHFGMWEGWGWWYDTGQDPRTAPGVGLLVFFSADDDRSAQEKDRARAEALEEMAADRVEYPDVEPLELPHRRYYLWTGGLRSVTAFDHQPNDSPSLIWPEDRSWFVGAPIYTHEVAVAGTTAAVDAVVDDPRLNARRATPDDVLDIDD